MHFLRIEGLLLHDRHRDDLRLIVTTRRERNEELVPLRDRDTSQGLPLAVLVVLQDLLLVDLMLDAQVRATTLQETADHVFLREAFRDFHGRLHLTEADLPDGVGDGAKPLHKRAFGAAECEHHFVHDALLLLDLDRELGIAFLFERGDLLLVRALDAHLREDVVCESCEKLAHTPCGLRVLCDLFQSLRGHSGSFAVW